jgi:hypothetical protein
MPLFHSASLVSMGNLFGNLWVDLKKCIYWNPIFLSNGQTLWQPFLITSQKGKWVQLNAKKMDKKKNISLQNSLGQRA